MLQNKRGILVAFGAAVFFGACGSDDLTSIPTLLSQMFGADLTPAKEVPPVTGVTSSGSSDIIRLDSNTFRVITHISNMDSVLFAHIHAGDAATAGPVMVFLAGPYSTANNSVGKNPA